MESNLEGRCAKAKSQPGLFLGCSPIRIQCYGGRAFDSAQVLSTHVNNVVFGFMLSHIVIVVLYKHSVVYL